MTPLPGKRFALAVVGLLAYLASSPSIAFLDLEDERRSVSPVERASSGAFQAPVVALIDGRDPTLGLITPAARRELRELYQSKGELLWLDAADRPTASAREALALLSDAAGDGLDPSDYAPDVLADLTRRLDVEDPGRALNLARFDVTLSAAVLRYLRHLHRGRIEPERPRFGLDAPEDPQKLPALRRAALAGGRMTAVVASVRPPLAQYDVLRSLLPRYRALADDPQLVVPPALPTAVHPGESYGAISSLYRLLMALGDLPGDTSPPPTDRYDGALVEGVKRFQTRHGLVADGVLGQNTIAALRVPLSWRIRQIELTLERLRWLPPMGSQRLIALNIPMFRVWAIDERSAERASSFGMNAIVGRALQTETPVLAEQMREVVFRPYWNVPSSILRHEVLPEIERDPDYLRRQDMEIVSGASDNAQQVPLTVASVTGLRQGVLRVRQRPGAKNALGLIKFVFPNQQDVYMHGTPAPALFARSRRDFSHGCVRVADPVALAEWVLRDNPDWTRDRIVAATLGTQTIRVRLARPIQVLLFYTTAAVTPEDGAIRFADDIYRLDARLDAALRRPRVGAPAR